MRSRHAFVLCVATLLAVPTAAGAVPGSVGAVVAGPTHGDHVSVDAQAVGDGTVIVETVSSTGPSFVALWADSGGQRGALLGSASVPAATFRTSVVVPVDAEAWRDWSGNRTVRAVLHRDDGDGEFDPDSDPSMARRNPAAAATFALGRTESGADRVLARVFGPQRLREGRLTVRRVDLSRSGFVVATSIEGDRVVGTRALDAGTHRNVTLALKGSFLADQRRDFRVRLVAYHDDGDGTFDADDRPVTVGGDPVATSLVVRKQVTTTTTRPLVITPTPGETTATTGPPPTPTAVATDSPSTATPRSSSTPGSSASTNADGPGFGGLAVLPAIALAVAALAVGRRLGGQ